MVMTSDNCEASDRPTEATEQKLKSPIMLQ